MASITAPHSIHGAFGGLSFTPSYAVPAPSVSSPRAAAFAQIPNISLPSGRGTAGHGRARGLSILASRTASAPTEVSTPVARRAPPPPPSRIPYIPPQAEDPFADGPTILPDTDVEMQEVESYGPIIISLPPPPRPHPRSLPASPDFAPSQPAAPVRFESQPLPERQRGRLVASVLLNRGCGYGRPMMRRHFGGAREYVKSGLSRVLVPVEDDAQDDLFRRSPPLQIPLRAPH
ncbi:hypothetical protein SCP_0412470 [Sparassis crispa]|uniref:Uncharacterized protein n=1 Tax=Sparassis crispa TaxID=139825 RepID=A0A401GL24_9APHY|nr:hypothetical protein SCP_0412470 [Sparassis crispa]GBE82860.1 hypothetical protein SCP_0412470 [Sparassis crispa]